MMISPSAVRSIRNSPLAWQNSKNSSSFIFIAGVSFWLVYGLRAGLLPIVVANAVTLALNLGILAVKVRHGRR